MSHVEQVASSGSPSSHVTRPGFIIDWHGAGFLIFAGTGRHWAMSHGHHH